MKNTVLAFFKARPDEASLLPLNYHSQPHQEMLGAVSNTSRIQDPEEKVGRWKWMDWSCPTASPHSFPNETRVYGVHGKPLPPLRGHPLIVPIDIPPPPGIFPALPNSSASHPFSFLVPWTVTCFNESRAPALHRFPTVRSRDAARRATTRRQQPINTRACTWQRFPLGMRFSTWRACVETPAPVRKPSIGAWGVASSDGHYGDAGKETAPPVLKPLEGREIQKESVEYFTQLTYSFPFLLPRKAASQRNRTRKKWLTAN